MVHQLEGLSDERKKTTDDENETLDVSYNH